ALLPSPSSTTGISASGSILTPNSSAGSGGQAGVDPFGIAVFQAAGGYAAAAQFADGVVGVDAVRAAAVGDDFLAVGEVVEFGVQRGDRHAAGAEDVPGLVFRDRPDVEDDNLAGAQPAGQLVAADRLQ